MTGNESNEGRRSIASRLRKFFAPIDHRARESKQFKMLLSESELTSYGLTFAGEQSWTIGNRGFAGPEIERARGRGNLNVWRRFANKSEKTSLWIQIGEFATAVDATSFAPQLFDSVLQRPGVATELIDVTEKVDVAGLLSTLAGDERSPYHDGFRRTRVIVGTIDQWIISSGFSSTNEVWSWDDIASILSAQVQKIGSRSV
jgi:hypothetical protein